MYSSEVFLRYASNDYKQHMDLWRYMKICRHPFYLELRRTWNVHNMGHVMRKCLRAYANNEGPDQPVHPRSLLRAFTVRL